MGLKFYWLVARLSCEGLPGMGFEILLKSIFEMGWEIREHMCRILMISLMCQKICGLGFGLFLRGGNVIGRMNK